MSEVWLSPKEVTNIEKITEMTFFRRFRRGQYPKHRYIDSSNGGRGGKKLQIALSCLSSVAQAEYWRTHNQPSLPANGAEAHSVPVSAPRAGTPARLIIPGLTERQNKVGSARFDLLMDYIRAKSQAKKARRKKEPAECPLSVGVIAMSFVEAYNAGLSHTELFPIVGKVTKRTLDKWHWELSRNKFDMTILAPQYGRHRKGKRKVTPEEEDYLKRGFLEPNGQAFSQIIRWAKGSMCTDGVPSPSSESTMRRWLEDYRDTHFPLWTMIRKGEKAWNDNCRPYSDRDADRLEVGDVVVADGHTLNFQVINPSTGRPARATLLLFYDWKSRYPCGWYLMLTENIQCIHAALRRAILALGKIPQWVYLDNGRAFRAKHFTQTTDFEKAGIQGVYARLGIRVHFAARYHAQSKPVERFFGTFNELERLFSSYVGASIKDKPAYLKPNERLHKSLHNPFVPTIEQADQIVRAWVEKEYSRRPHRGLKGRTPAEVWEAGKGPGIDEAALRSLMMSEKSTRVYQNGIKLRGNDYWDEALYNYRKPVLVRYDIAERERVFVYTEDGSEELCEAKLRPPLHPMAAMSDNRRDLQMVRERNDQARQLKRQTIAQVRELVGHVNWALPEATPEPERQLTPAEAEKIMEEAARTPVIPINQKEKEDLLFDSEIDRYDHLFGKKCKGEELKHEDVAFMADFEQSNHYRMLKSHYESIAQQANT